MRIHHSLIFFFVLLWTAAAAAQGPSWYIYKGKDFEQAFPRQPQDTMMLRDMGGSQMEIFSLVLRPSASDKDPNSVYVTMRTTFNMPEFEHPGEGILTGYFRGLVNSQLKATNGRIVSEKDTTLAGIVGKEYTISYANDKKLVLLKAYVGNGKSYSLQIMTDAGKEKNANALKFFSSFKPIVE